MTKWTKKAPSKYPIYFGQTVIDAAISGGSRLLATKSTMAEIIFLQSTFHEWRFNLRDFGPRTETAKLEHDCRITTKIKTITGGPRDLFQLWVEIKPKLLGTLHLLNPKLMAEIDRD